MTTADNFFNFVIVNCTTYYYSLSKYFIGVNLLLNPPLCKELYFHTVISLLQIKMLMRLRYLLKIKWRPENYL